MDSEQLADLIRRSLKRSRRVEIDGPGIFELGNTRRVSLHHANRPRVFIAYATEDIAVAEKLFDSLWSPGVCALTGSP